LREETAALIAIVQTSRRSQARELAVRQLVELEDPDAAPALIALLENTTDPRLVPLVTTALGGLQRLGRAVVSPALVVLNGPPDPRRAFMPLLLATALGQEAIPRLIEALDDVQHDVQINAATQLGLLRDRRAFDPLLAVAQDPARDSAVRGAAIAALGNLRDRRALPLLIAYTRESDSDLLAGAIDGLADLRDPAGIEPLEAILARPELDKRTERAVRLALLAMERYRDP
jgi:HEAT repeat protein